MRHLHRSTESRLDGRRSADTGYGARRQTPGKRATGWVAVGDGVPPAEDWLDLLRDPMRIDAVPPYAIPPLLCQLAALQSALAARLLVQPAPTDGHGTDADTLLDVGEAARRLGTSTDWLYRHADRLPFTVRMGPRQLRFSAMGLARYLRQRQGR